MMEQLSFFGRDARDIIRDDLVIALLDLNKEYQTMTEDEIIKRFERHKNSGGSFTDGMQIAWWTDSITISTFESGHYEDYTFTHKEIARQIIERR